jgi:hypothetical protein
MLQVQIASMCMCVNISATVALGCLFAPKVYIVLFQPKKNVRQVNTQVRSTRFSASQEDPVSTLSTKNSLFSPEPSIVIKRGGRDFITSSFINERERRGKCDSESMPERLILNLHKSRREGERAARSALKIDCDDRAGEEEIGSTIELCECAARDF